MIFLENFEVKKMTNTNDINFEKLREDHICELSERIESFDFDYMLSYDDLYKGLKTHSFLCDILNNTDDDFTDDQEAEASRIIDDVQFDMFHKYNVEIDLTPAGEAVYYSKDQPYDKNGFLITHDFKKHIDENNLYQDCEDIRDKMRDNLINHPKWEAEKSINET